MHRTSRLYVTERARGRRVRPSLNGGRWDFFIVSLTLSRSLYLALQDRKRARERAHQPERTAGPGFTREGAAGGREEPAQHSTWRGVRTNLKDLITASVSRLSHILSHCLTGTDSLSMCAAAAVQ